MQRLRFLVWKEFLELRMNPRLFGVVIVAPIIQLTMLGYAATTDVKDVPVVVADGDRSRAQPRADRPVRRLAQLHRHRRRSRPSREIEPYLERGSAWLALSIPAGYGAALERHAPATVQVVADGTDSNSTTVALGYATSLIGGYAQELVAARPAGGRRRRRPSRRASASGSTRSSRAGTS